jgi:hypothetical protein
MGRQEKHSVDYFPFFVKRGKTLNILQNKYGLEGIGFFTNLMRFLAETPDHYYCIKEEYDKLNLFSEIGIKDDEKGLDMIDLMVRTGKLDEALWKNHKVIVCEAFIESLEEAYKRRSNKIVTIEEIREIFETGGGNPEPAGEPAGEPVEEPAGEPVGEPVEEPVEEPECPNAINVYKNAINVDMMYTSCNKNAQNCDINPQRKEKKRREEKRKESHTLNSDSDSVARGPPFEKKGVCVEKTKYFEPQNSFCGEKPPESISKAENPPEIGDEDRGFDKNAELHPGQSPPFGDDYETIRKTWNTPYQGVKLPECRFILTNLNIRQREILGIALRHYKTGEIVNAVENYLWMRKNTDKVRVCLQYADMFNFLEKGLPSFSEDGTFNSAYLKCEGK